MLLSKIIRTGSIGPISDPLSVKRDRATDKWSEPKGTKSIIKIYMKSTFSVYNPFSYVNV